MLKRSAAFLLLLSLCISCASAAGIDDDYIKPGSSKWGDVLERLLGAEGVREELRAYHWSRGL
jgi:hypothetical protein